MLYGFLLGREFKLSIAEIFSVFKKYEIIYSGKSILILSGLDKEEILEKAKFLGGTIKIFELSLKVDKKDIFKEILLEVKNKNSKFNYGFNLFPEKQEKLQKILIEIKRFLSKKNISSRYVNKTNKNLTSAQILGNSLLKKGIDFNLVDLGGIFYFGKTIWVQDIDAYSSRDFSKSRDMQVGMLPPKLAQMMINLAGNNEKFSSIYDPFVGLGTILIEAKLMGFNKLYGSDLSEKMVEISTKNISSKSKDLIIKIEKLNAKFVNELSFWQEVKDGIIVTEGYLGEVMTKKNISLDRIQKQKESLKKIYEGFFSSLKKGNFSGNIVISFPFWDFKGKYIFFEEVYDILEKYTEKISFFPDDFDFSETKEGSLLYKREKQLVGREIFKLKLK